MAFAASSSGVSVAPSAPYDANAGAAPTGRPVRPVLGALSGLAVPGGAFFAGGSVLGGLAAFGAVIAAERLSGATTVVAGVYVLSAIGGALLTRRRSSCAVPSFLSVAFAIAATSVAMSLISGVASMLSGVGQATNRCYARMWVFVGLQALAFAVSPEAWSWVGRLLIPACSGLEALATAWQESGPPRQPPGQ